MHQQRREEQAGGAAGVVLSMHEGIWLRVIGGGMGENDLEWI